MKIKYLYTEAPFGRKCPLKTTQLLFYNTSSVHKQLPVLVISGFLNDGICIGKKYIQNISSNVICENSNFSKIILLIKSFFDYI